MSLFDTIKYPISYPPKSEEFQALPKEILMQWTEGYSQYHYQTYEYRLHLLGQLIWPDREPLSIGILRRMIAEYDNESI